jgi:hypothetical protein
VSEVKFRLALPRVKLGLIPVLPTPYLTNAAQLASSLLRFAGPLGQYHPHELIRFPCMLR